MELKRFLKRREKPSGPTPTQWLSAAKLEIPNGSLFVGDPHLDARDAYVAKVPAGKYILEAKLRDLDNQWWVSRVRARLDGHEKPRLGKKIGETCTDLAAIAFYDLVAAQTAIAGDNERYVNLLVKKNLETCGVVQIRMKKVMRVAYVATGFDCEARVYELRSGRRRVGVEVEIDFEELEWELSGEFNEPSEYVPRPPLPGLGFEKGACIHCRGTGDCFCIRKEGKISTGCPRCGGSGKCSVCEGRGKWDPMKILGLTEPFCAVHRVRFLAEADRSVLQTIRCGVLFIMAFFDGRAYSAFEALKKVLETDAQGRLELVIMDCAGCPDLHRWPEFQDGLATAGETAWVKDGCIVGTALQSGTASLLAATTVKS